ncbi:uncharacterized protein LOC110704206 [Chenopodium quinoa]|uniref:uncharacterized protein LOC110704206 n=1 Tax=Chenopodium quinoa TaxID=63459 RepID=UPI000B78DBE6|nr:uncharacterized protein LOC110704206 [Chenopodium quinoa]
MEAKGALADVGASVSLIPLSIVQKLNIEMIPTRKTIQLADRSVKLPCGELEDVPIKVAHIYVPCDFVVMDMEEDVDTPLILGREALKTLGAFPPTTSVTGVRAFLGHAGFYRRFIKNFSSIAKPLTELLKKDVVFNSDGDCLEAFKKLMEALISSPVVQAPDWSLHFELMCDVSDFEVGAVLGKKKKGRSHVIYYASRTLDEAQMNYTTTKKEMLVVVFAMDKFRSYLICSKVIVYTDHIVVCYLMTKKEAKSRLIRWVLSLKDFDMEMRDKKGPEKYVADHLSKVPFEYKEDVPINEDLEFETLMAMASKSSPWYANIANYLACGVVPPELSSQQKKRFFKEVRRYFWNDPYLFKQCGDGLFQKYVPDHEIEGVLEHCHSLPCGGHGGVEKMVAKISQSLLWWPTMHKNGHKFHSRCDKCQRSGGITKRDDMPEQNILEVEPYDVWGVDFMGHFVSSCGNLYILVVVDYVTKWIEAIPSPTNGHKIVLKLLKKATFPRFGVPRVLISDEGSHFAKK